MASEVSYEVFGYLIHLQIVQGCGREDMGRCGSLCEPKAAGSAVQQ